KRGSISQDPVDRVAWANQNYGIIREISQGNVLDAEVTTVKKDVSSREGYLVETGARGTYLARKVVVATGAGIETSDRQYHHVPDEVAQFRNTGYTQAQRILDLDQFQKGQESSRMGRGKAVAIIGPNAGTDAIMEAATRGYTRENVYWLMSPRHKPGVALTWDVTSAIFTVPEPLASPQVKSI
ncbi:MAG: type III effector, partial [candidate division Zixibacteria bacterium]|nr:type III effector [candidate division Zixibacteria bacterium]